MKKAILNLKIAVLFFLALAQSSPRVSAADFAKPERIGGIQEFPIADIAAPLEIPQPQSEESEKYLDFGDTTLRREREAASKNARVQTQSSKPNVQYPNLISPSSTRNQFRHTKSLTAPRLVPINEKPIQTQAFRQLEEMAERESPAAPFDTIIRRIDRKFGPAPKPMDVAADHELSRFASRFRTQSQLARLRETPRAETEPFAFSVIGDAEPGLYWWDRVFFNRRGVFPRLLSEASRKSGDFVMQLGDMTTHGLRSEFLEFFRQLVRAPLKAAYLTIQGNHDRSFYIPPSNGRVYSEIFGSGNYYFDHGGYRFVAVDSSARKITHRQLDWLNRVLDSPRRLIVFTHMPPASVKSLAGYGPLSSQTGFSEGSELFSRILAERGVERVYVGHIHGFATAVHLGIRYVLTGGGGSPLFPSKARRIHHFLYVQAGPEGLRETLVRPNGRAVALKWNE